MTRWAGLGPGLGQPEPGPGLGLGLGLGQAHRHPQLERVDASAELVELLVELRRGVKRRHKLFVVAVDGLVDVAADLLVGAQRGWHRAHSD